MKEIADARLLMNKATVRKKPVTLLFSDFLFLLIVGTIIALSVIAYQQQKEISKLRDMIITINDCLQLEYSRGK